MDISRQMAAATAWLWCGSLLLPLAGALLLALWPRRWDGAAKLMASIVLLLAAICASASLTLEPAAGELRIFGHWPWVPRLGLGLVVARDGLSAMFALLVSWVAVLVVLYAWRYLPHANEHEEAERSESAFYALMCLFSGCMLGLVSSGNLVQIYLFWESTGIASYLLIGYWNHHREARAGAAQALGITVAGGISLLAGLLTLGIDTGHWELRQLLEAKPPTGTLLEVATVLVLIGALTNAGASRRP
jgi:NADH:ubiquinone oxidoreductase subunit 5 (subunit L)/multisubunit Na+/H+ antiporter MnhA subunit